MSKRLDRLKATLARFAKERDWDQFHTAKNLAMGVSVEAAEIAEIFMWLTPEQGENLSKEEVAHLKDELADTFVYLLKLAGRYDIDLIAAAEAKMRKNAKKYPVGKSRGLAKKYTQL